MVFTRKGCDFPWQFVNLLGRVSVLDPFQPTKAVEKSRQRCPGDSLLGRCTAGESTCGSSVRFFSWMIRLECALVLQYLVRLGVEVPKTHSKTTCRRDWSIRGGWRWLVSLSSNTLRDLKLFLSLICLSDGFTTRSSGDVEFCLGGYIM